MKQNGNTVDRIVCTSVGVCHHYDTIEDNTFESKLFAESDHVLPAMLIDDDHLDTKLSEYLSFGKIRRIDKLSKMCLLASLSCNQGTSLDIEKHRDDIGVIICSTYGAVSSSREFIKGALQNGPKNASPLIFPYSVPNAATGIITIELGVRGFNTTISGFNPMGYSYELLKLNKAKALFVGGVEEVTDELMEANSGNEDVATTLLGSLSEGAALVMLTSPEFAEENGQEILFEICGSANSCNIGNGTARIDNFGHINSQVIKKTMSDVLSKSGVDKDEIKVVVSLSGGHNQQTDSEEEAVQSIWGDNGPVIWNVKEVIGETFGASDTFGAISGYFYLKNNNITSGYAMINSYQIGGNVSSMLIKL